MSINPMDSTIVPIRNTYDDDGGGELARGNQKPIKNEQMRAIFSCMWPSCSENCDSLEQIERHVRSHLGSKQYDSIGDEDFYYEETEVDEPTYLAIFGHQRGVGAEEEDDDEGDEEEEEESSYHYHHLSNHLHNHHRNHSGGQPAPSSPPPHLEPYRTVAAAAAAGGRNRASLPPAVSGMTAGGRLAHKLHPQHHLPLSPSHNSDGLSSSRSFASSSPATSPVCSVTGGSPSSASSYQQLMTAATGSGSGSNQNHLTNHYNQKTQNHQTTVGQLFASSASSTGSNNSSSSSCSSSASSSAAGGGGSGGGYHSCAANSIDWRHFLATTGNGSGGGGGNQVKAWPQPQQQLIYHTGHSGHHHYAPAPQMKPKGRGVAAGSPRRQQQQKLSLRTTPKAAASRPIEHAQTQPRRGRPPGATGKTTAHLRCQQPSNYARLHMGAEDHLAGRAAFRGGGVAAAKTPSAKSRGQKLADNQPPAAAAAADYSSSTLSPACSLSSTSSSSSSSSSRSSSVSLPTCSPSAASHTGACPPLPVHPGATPPKPSGGRRARGENRKCRKVYGMDRRDLWCTQCKWKKACSRFCDGSAGATLVGISSSASLVGGAQGATQQVVVGAGM